jgi:hypothetical protein
MSLTETISVVSYDAVASNELEKTRTSNSKVHANASVVNKQPSWALDENGRFADCPTGAAEWT